MSAVELLHAALRDAARGWPVFPVNPRTNTPLLASAHPEGDPLRGRCHGECGQLGHGFHDATTDAELVRSWWTRHPNAAIGVRTGVGCDVLDIDLENFEEGVADLPDCETFGPSARSGGNNWHLYFKPSGLGRSIRFSAHCDWLGTDGYAIVPPSGHKSGGQYSWIVSPDEIELHDAPEVLLEAVRRGKVPPKVANARMVAPLLRPAPAATGGWSAAGVIAKMNATTEGERNTILWWGVRAIALDVYDGKIGQHAALEAVEQLAHSAESAGLTSLEVDRSVESGWATGLAGIRGKVGQR